MFVVAGAQNDDLYYDRIVKGEGAGARDFSNAALFGGDSKARQDTKFEKETRTIRSFTIDSKKRLCDFQWP